ncbi:HTTM domain-containing protein [Natronorubrum tibetense]|uniref:HTTM domain-containing protein n=1 Tax=Natronorubrum tibetense TaxID=63128 RepID=UPI000486777D|nr:HTTM domain-containing protein [Natronorubrum tibetense]
MTSPPPRLSAVAKHCTSVLEPLRTALGPRLGIDPRALGAFRIVLGVLLLVDLIAYRLPALVTFYTDEGVFPRSALAEVYPTFAAASLHAISGSAWVQGILFAIAGCFAIFLLVGYRTRLATGVSLLLLASLYARNPHVINGGNTILLTFLFFGLFLPLDARWSLDGGRRHQNNRRVYSVGTAVILLHFVIIYATNAVRKYQSEPWMSGTAVPRIFHVEEYFVVLGPHLTEYTTVLTAANWFWVGLLSMSPFLILSVGRFRIALVLAFGFVHLGMAATMRLGVFPFVMIAGLLLFLPPRVWDRIDGVRRVGGSSAFEPITRWIESIRGGEPEPEATTLPVIGARIRRGLRGCCSLVLACVLLSLLVWQLAGIGVVDSPVSDGELADASWAFFAPNPPDTSSWYVLEAELESGETVDAADGGEVAFDRPPDAAETYESALWLEYGLEMRNLGETHYEPAAAYFCQSAEFDVESVTIHHVKQPVDSDGAVGDPTSNERISYPC